MAKITQRPEYHFSAPKGWINDPNGLFFHDGYFHILYQANRYHTEWASPSIGHSRTKDFIHFEEMIDAVSPDMEYDMSERGGCFSGSIIHRNSLYHLVYTGSVFEKDTLIQTQNLATSTDGINFVKYEGNPIIPMPPEGADANFRDPKVFEHSGKLWMVVGCKKGDVVSIFLYTSLDCINWEYKGVLYKGNGRDGTLAECPDLYPVGNGYWLLTFSPEHHKEGVRSVGKIGMVDLEKCSFDIFRTFPMDYGLDYYARQSYEVEGRRISLAWLNQWPWMSHYQGHGNSIGEGWCGCLGMPREDVFINGHLESFPVKEITNRFQKSEEETLVVTPENNKIFKTHSYALWLSLTIDKKDCECGEFVIRTEAFDFRINLEHSFVVAMSKGKNTSLIPLECDAKITMDFFFDNSVLELFIDGGRQNASWIFEREKESPDLEILVNQKCCRLNYSLSYLEAKDELH